MQDDNAAVNATPVGSVTGTTAKKAGRKRDTTGSTALGKARLIHAANPGLSAADLRDKLFAELNPVFNSSKSTCQTYASLLRKAQTTP